MSSTIIQQLWTLILPLVAFIISYVIQQEHWKPETNGLIALITIVVATGISLWLQGGNIDDATIVAALATAAQSEALAPLMPYVRGFPVKSAPPVSPPTSQPPT